MFAQANEAARCYKEKVLRSVADANIGSIFGWGFAPFQGGALQFINAYGPKKFVGHLLTYADTSRTAGTDSGCGRSSSAVE